MKRIITAVTLCLLSACFDAVEPLPLGSVGGGNGSTGGGSAASGGGTASGGGGATGGGTSSTGGGDGGLVVVIVDGGFVYPLADLPEENCGSRQQFTCPGDAGPCITWDTATSQEVVVTSAQLANLHSVAGRAGDELAYLTSLPDGGNTLWSAAGGRAPRMLREGDALSVSSISASASGYAWWFVGGHGSGPDSYGYDISYVLPSGGVNVAIPSKPASPTSNGVAWGSSYAVAMLDGLHSFYPAGESLLVQPSLFPNDTIQGIAVDEATSDLFYVRFDSENGARLWRHDNATGDETLLTDLPSVNGVQLANGGMVALHGGYVYVLSVVGLHRMAMDGSGDLQLVFRGEEFPQYGGTLKSGSLVVHGDKFYFGKVCHYDADAPGYGTVELDVVNLSARWLDLDPAYPLVPHVTGYLPWGEGPVYASPSGAFIFRN
ncbi:MAG: hypothetical protein ACO1OB_12495 [Archangium sp.]